LNTICIGRHHQIEGSVLAPGRTAGYRSRARRPGWSTPARSWRAT